MLGLEKNINNKIVVHAWGIKITLDLNIFKKLKQDKNSEVEFYLVDAFEIYHFMPIYKELINIGIKAKIVAEPCHINTSGSWFNYEKAVEILKENNIDYCTKCNQKAKAAITTQNAKILKKYKNKKINLSYGCGFNYNNFGLTKEACENFDARLVHGNFYRDIASQFIKKEVIFTIGYPKYDDFWNNNISKDEIKTKLNINTDKPILAYFPTWDEDSSIQQFANSIKSLKKEFFILTKPHHCTFRLSEKKEDLKKLYEISDLVLEGNSPFEYAVLMADCAIADAKSGSSSEVIYLKPEIPIIFLSVQQDIENYFYPEIFKLANVINFNKDLKVSLLETIKKRKSAKEYITYFYENYNGCSAKTAVKAILKIIENKKGLIKKETK